MPLDLLLFHEVIAPWFEIGKAAIQAVGDAIAQPYRGARQIFQEAPVMADQHQGRAAGFEFLFQPFDGRQVEMIGRLVEK